MIKKRSSDGPDLLGISLAEFSLVPPKKVIKALYDYRAQGPGELSFHRGDFLYVVGNEDHPEWYEASHPPTRLKGMVPVSYFELVVKSDPSSKAVPIELVHGMGSARDSDPELSQKRSVAESISPSKTPPTHKRASQTPLYGIVLYDFAAERADELQASAGESIIIIAQSTSEWVVAKPIGRLGGPGLIPVSFVQIRSVESNRPVDDVQKAIQLAGVPKVEEWKKMAANYKASSIPLGRFDDEFMNPSPNIPPTSGDSAAAAAVAAADSWKKEEAEMYRNMTSSTTTTHNSVGSSQSRTKTGSVDNPIGHHITPYNQQQQRQHQSVEYYHSNEPYVTDASVDRYSHDGKKFWFLVVAELSNGHYRKLCRYYQDFYDFQIRLLEEFPVEAGRTGEKRSLPFMPGPVTYVNESITAQRRANLNNYVTNLVALPDYISRSPTVQSLFALQSGDIETAAPTDAMPHPPKQASHDSLADSSLAIDRRSNPLTSSHHGSSQVSEDSAAMYQLNHHHHQHHPRQASHSDVQLKSKSSDAHLSSSVSSLVAGAPGHDTTSIKVKVFHDEDLIAMKFPSNISFDTLASKISQRLDLPDLNLLFKDEKSGSLIRLSNNAELAYALGSKTKLVLYAK